MSDHNRELQRQQFYSKQYTQQKSVHQIILRRHKNDQDSSDQCKNWKFPKQPSTAEWINQSGVFM